MLIELLVLQHWSILLFGMRAEGHRESCHKGHRESCHKAPPRSQTFALIIIYDVPLFISQEGINYVAEPRPDQS
jgi:hypothetical protein